jgi:hypothetical protein
MAVEINKKIVGSIGHGETVDLNIDPGHHTLRLGSKRHPALNEASKSSTARSSTSAVAASSGSAHT